MVHTGLPKDWVFRPYIDLELKQYTLLAYLQRVQQRFAEEKLYPHLEEIRAHLDELLRLRSMKADFERNLQGDLVGFDPRTGQALHEPVTEHELLAVLDEIIDMAVPDLQRMWSDGSDLRSRLAEGIHFSPVGVLPLRSHEGWLLLRSGRETRVYNFAMPLLRESSEAYQYRSVVTHYVTSYSMGIAHTYEHIKAELVKQHRHMPAPATFAFEAERELPYIETYMPLAKQLVYEHIAKVR
jgi:hypothetical protein